MKLSILIFSALFCCHAMAMSKANVNVCPKTRNCNQDTDCKMYAVKHGCHGICYTKKIKNYKSEIINCEPQCICEERLNKEAK